ncbi:MAG TPA: rod-binding protein [Rhabdaerophilum sp.]|nr:rod-binding protein [Rhabdaerophilum sp.]
MNGITSNPNFALDIRQAQAAGKLSKNAPLNQKAWETAQGLEASFLQTMLGTMFEGVKGEGMMGAEATGQDAWRGMMIEQYGKSLAAKGGIGLAPQIYREMLRYQESAPNVAQRPQP